MIAELITNCACHSLLRAKPRSEIPGWLKAIAAIFPLRWMSEGFRYAFLPDWFGEVEYGSTWGWQWPVGILSVWVVVAGALAFWLFRWDRSSGE